MVVYMVASRVSNYRKRMVFCANETEFEGNKWARCMASRLRARMVSWRSMRRSWRWPGWDGSKADAAPSPGLRTSASPRDGMDELVQFEAHGGKLLLHRGRAFPGVVERPGSEGGDALAEPAQIGDKGDGGLDRFGSRSAGGCAWQAGLEDQAIERIFRVVVREADGPPWLPRDARVVVRLAVDCHEAIRASR